MIEGITPDAARARIVSALTGLTVQGSPSTATGTDRYSVTLHESLDPCDPISGGKSTRDGGFVCEVDIDQIDGEASGSPPQWKAILRVEVRIALRTMHKPTSIGANLYPVGRQVIDAIDRAFQNDASHPIVRRRLPRFGRAPGHPDWFIQRVTFEIHTWWQRS